MQLFTEDEMRNNIARRINSLQRRRRFVSWVAKFDNYELNDEGNVNFSAHHNMSFKLNFV